MVFLGQARQVVESAVAFNLPEVTATVDEMQAESGDDVEHLGNG